MKTSSIGEKLLVVLTATLLIALGLTPTWAAKADTSPKGDTPDTVSNDSLPTAQIDSGVVWTQTIIGNTVYAGGEFSKARPPGAAPGQNTVTRNNLLAYDISTGQLKSFAPNVNGSVLGLAPSPDGSRLYVAGMFTKINGVTRYRIAALNPTTGDVITSFNAAVNYRARTIVATNTTVYIGGGFTVSRGNSRVRLAAFNASNGELLNWAPSADREVMAMVLTPDRSKIVIGGQFLTVNGADHFGMTALDPTTGATVPWQATNLVRNAGPRAAVNSLVADDKKVYGTGYVFGKSGNIPKGNMEGLFAADGSTGEIEWIADCHGDHYSAFSNGETVYGVGHAHECDTLDSFPRKDPWWFWRAVAFSADARGTVGKTPHSAYYNFEGQPAPDMLHWWGNLKAGTFTGQTQAAWHVTGNSDYTLLGGEFPTVNGANQQGLARYARPGLAPKNVGPVLSGGNFKPSLVSVTSGSVRVGFDANWDRDNEYLVHKVIRDNDVAHPVHEEEIKTTFWDLPRVDITDSGLTPGRTYNYRLHAVDPDGNVAIGNNVSVNVTSGSLSTYAAGVLDDSPYLFWRLGENGSTVYDWANANDGNASAGVSRGTSGAIIGDSDKASTFSGSSSGLVADKNALPQPGSDTFSLETWIRTGTNSGGKIIGFGDERSGLSDNYDRHVYMTNGGNLIFGVYSGGGRTIRSSQSYNDGDWHHVVATLGPDGQRLLVDGQSVGYDANIHSGQSFSGHWRVGGDRLNGWSQQPSSNYFAGDIDDVAIYPKVLSQAEVNQHFALSGHGAPLPDQPPTARFTSTVNDLSVATDARGSSDPDGVITGYAWDFGDGGSGSGATPNHTYAIAGSYDVELTVTDNDGDADSVTHQVTVTDPGPSPNEPPTAAFTFTTSDLEATFDGTSSQDDDGSIASHSWDFGDGGSGSGATPNHTYATAGSYDVELTVTDDDSDADSVTHQVTVSTGGPAPAIALDTFNRTSSSGWGTADLGGSWSHSGGTGNFSVSGGTGSMIMDQSGRKKQAWLGSVAETSSDTSATLSLNKNQTGGGTYLYLLGRRISNNTSYHAKARIKSNQEVVLYLIREVNGSSTNLSSQTIAGLTYSAGDQIRIRLQVDGTPTTSLKAKVWLDGGGEPDWQLTASDATAAVQSPGSVGLNAYLSSSSSSAPITITVSDFDVSRLP
jgi:PKD repeat protein